LVSLSIVQKFRFSNIDKKAKKSRGIVSTPCHADVVDDCCVSQCLVPCQGQAKSTVASSESNMSKKRNEKKKLHVDPGLQ
jgi:hypothetical protein